MSEPVVAVDKTVSPSRGTVYVVYPGISLGDPDLFCVSSTDHGRSWSRASRANNDSVGNGRDQYHFWMTVDDSGFVDVVFLDSRNDPNNILCDAYFAQSRDGGITFENFRITPRNFDPRITPNGDVRFGEYIGIDARGSRIVPCWVDTRSGNQDICIAVIDQGRTGSIWGTVSAAERDGYMDWPVLLAHDNGVDTAFADYYGQYSFTGLFPGTYRVTCGTRPGWRQSSPDSLKGYTVVIDSSETDTGRDFHNSRTTLVPPGERALSFSLDQNYPNPFNPSTTLRFTIPEESYVTLAVYDVLGEEVATLVSGRRPAGTYTIPWDGRGLPSGVYYCRLVAGMSVRTHPMVLIR